MLLAPVPTRAVVDSKSHKAVAAKARGALAKQVAREGEAEVNATEEVVDLTWMMVAAARRRCHTTVSPSP